MHRTWAVALTRAIIPDNLEIIKTVGYEHVMVDTDGGQTENPKLGAGFRGIYAISG